MLITLCKSKEKFQRQSRNGEIKVVCLDTNMLGGRGVSGGETPSSASIEHDRRLMELIMLPTVHQLVTAGNKTQLVSEFTSK